MAQINVKIAGHSYRMACDDGQEGHIEGLAATLDARIANLKAGFGEIGDQRLVVMAAIIIEDELQEAKAKAANLEGQLKALRAQRTPVEDGNLEQTVSIVNNVAERLENLAKGLAA